MSTRILMSLSVLPYLAMQRRPRLYFAATLLVEIVVLLGMAAWLAAPLALWKAFGFGWLLLWLLPTSGLIFAYVLMPQGGG